MRAEAAAVGLQFEGAPLPSAIRVLLVGHDAATETLLLHLLNTDLWLFEAAAVSLDEALRALESDDAVDCLLIDVSLPDGLKLLVAARELRPEIKTVAVAASPGDELHQVVLESGAARFFAKPLDFEDLLTTLASARPGGLSHLKGDLDFVELCRLSAACHPNEGLYLQYPGGEGVVVLRGGRIVHAEAGALIGEPALELLRGATHLHFRSLPAGALERLEDNCLMALPGASTSPAGGKVGGCLRGLTLRHLIELMAVDRLSCTMTITSQGGTGVMIFETGRILRAETAEHEGALAATEILGWENLRVELSRPAPQAPGLPPRKSELQTLVDRFGSEIEGFIAASVMRRRDTAELAGCSADATVGSDLAAACYGGVIDSHLAAVASIGVSGAWGGTEDILITVARAYVMIRLLGDGHYLWLAVSREANMALCRLLMRTYEPFLLSALADCGEIAAA
ncbi:MAG TPA: response regulator [Thermoanaerobaculia bacterium]|nr:response regulator [Thermoanaerobaculia bacterium]